jgi:gp16 family phage-associated protein
MTPTDTPSKVRAALRTRGTSLRRWAIAKGYHPATAYQVVREWSGRSRRPLGGIGRSIIADLRAELGNDILPPPTGAGRKQPSRRVAGA